MKQKILILILLSFVSLFVVQALLMLLLFVFIDHKPEVNNWGILITNISLLIIIWFTQKKIKINLKFVFPSIKIFIYTILLAICFVFCYPLVTILNFINNIGSNVIEFSMLDFTLNLNSLIYYFNIVLITPVLEEIYYRKIILHQLVKKYNIFFAIIFSSILFSVFHLDYIQCQISFVFGLLSGYLYVKTKRIEISILLHSLINLFIIITSNNALQLNGYYFLIPTYITIVLLGYILVKKIIKNVDGK